MAVYRKTKFGWRKDGECVQCKEKAKEIYDNDQLNKTETEEVKETEVTEKPKKKKKKDE